MTMKPGISRFDYFLNQLQPILTEATKQKNPALWLYRNNARTPLFMLESLAIMYNGFHNAKKIAKIKDHFKLLEDTLGAIDYYDTATKDLATNKQIPISIINYLQAQSREKIQSLNEMLAEKDWLLPVNNRIIKIRKKLEKADWLTEADEVKRMNEFYGESIYEIVAFAQSINFLFSDMEGEVHELRRKLRWLSIYPQAIRGAIQFGKSKTLPKYLAKYSTKEIVTSPYNKMPDAGDAKCFLLLNQAYFYALSWMIAALGTIKDDGLRFIAVKEALQQTEGLTDVAANKKAIQFLGKKQPKMEELLEKASDICKTYFKEQNLEHLVIGTSMAK